MWWRKDDLYACSERLSSKLNIRYTIKHNVYYRHWVIPTFPDGSGKRLRISNWLKMLHRRFFSCISSYTHSGVRPARVFECRQWNFGISDSFSVRLAQEMTNAKLEERNKIEGHWEKCCVQRFQDFSHTLLNCIRIVHWNTEHSSKPPCCVVLWRHKRWAGNRNRIENRVLSLLQTIYYYWWV